MIEVRTMELSQLCDREARLYSDADAQRRERASRYVHADDRLRCLAAGYLMKHCLPGYSASHLRKGPDGKPFLAGGVPFSLSHGGNYIVLAWCEDAPDIAGVGVDVEPVRDMAYYQAILPCFMTAEERSTAGGDAAQAVRIWTRKESLYKCSGEGVSDFLQLPPVHHDRVLFQGKPARLTSWEACGHSFSAALWGSDAPFLLNIRGEAL